MRSSLVLPTGPTARNDPNGVSVRERSSGARKPSRGRGVPKVKIASTGTSRPVGEARGREGRAFAEDPRHGLGFEHDAARAQAPLGLWRDLPEACREDDDPVAPLSDELGLVHAQRRGGEHAEATVADLPAVATPSPSTSARALARSSPGGAPSWPRTPCMCEAKRLRGLSASITSVRRRARPSMSAADRPAAPPPTMIASHEFPVMRPA
jgi:hypothetical protein